MRGRALGVKWGEGEATGSRSFANAPRNEPAAVRAVRPICRRSIVRMRGRMRSIQVEKFIGNQQGTAEGGHGGGFISLFEVIRNKRLGPSLFILRGRTLPGMLECLLDPGFWREQYHPGCLLYTSEPVDELTPAALLLVFTTS